MGTGVGVGLCWGVGVLGGSVGCWVGRWVVGYRIVRCLKLLNQSFDFAIILVFSVQFIFDFSVFCVSDVWFHVSEVFIF